MSKINTIIHLYFFRKKRVRNATNTGYVAHNSVLDLHELCHDPAQPQSTVFSFALWGEIKAAVITPL